MSARRNDFNNTQASVNGYFAGELANRFGCVNAVLLVILAVLVSVALYLWVLKPVVSYTWSHFDIEQGVLTEPREQRKSEVELDSTESVDSWSNTTDMQENRDKAEHELNDFNQE